MIAPEAERVCVPSAKERGGGLKVMGDWAGMSGRGPTEEIEVHEDDRLAEEDR